MHEYTYEHKGMGGDVSISIVTEEQARADNAYERMIAIVTEDERRFSRFLPDSELSRLNRTRSMQVSPEFLRVVGLGKELCRATAGVFNPLVSIARYGYDADIAVVRGTERGSRGITVPYNIDCDALQVDEDTRTVTLAPGQQIDVGGYLKGYTAEKMARAAGTAGVIVNLAGDIFTCGVGTDGFPFEFSIEHPRDPSVSITIPVSDGGIATSGSYRRWWSYRGEPFFHILNETGTANPDTDILSATVIAPTGYSADAYATTALSLGSDKAAAVLEGLGYSYYFILKDGRTIASPHLAVTVEHTSPAYVD